MKKDSADPLFPNPRPPKVKDWLMEGERYILAGRYLAAEKILQRVLAADPSNELALSYRDRIQFLTKQVLHKASLSKEVQTEIRRAKDILYERKMNEASVQLKKGKQLLDDGNYREAQECLTRVIEIDQENAYARALLERIKELYPITETLASGTESDIKFIAALRRAWANGIPSDSEIEYLRRLQKEISVSDGHWLALERKVKNHLYKEALREVWLTGGISAFSSYTIGEEVRKKYAVSLIDHSSIEVELFQEVRKNKMKGVILIVDEDESMLLEIARHLRVNLFAVIAAASFEEALASIRTSTPDAVLSEITFNSAPVGFDLFKTIRSAEFLKTIPFFFMMHQLDRTTHLIGKRLGVDDFFLKPLDYEILFATLEGKIRRSAGTH